MVAASSSSLYTCPRPIIQRQHAVILSTSNRLCQGMSFLTPQRGATRYVPPRCPPPPQVSCPALARHVLSTRPCPPPCSPPCPSPATTRGPRPQQLTSTIGRTSRLPSSPTKSSMSTAQWRRRHLHPGQVRQRRWLHVPIPRWKPRHPQYPKSFGTRTTGQPSTQYEWPNLVKLLVHHTLRGSVADEAYVMAISAQSGAPLGGSAT